MPSVSSPHIPPNSGARGGARRGHLAEGHAEKFTLAAPLPGLQFFVALPVSAGSTLSLSCCRSGSGGGSGSHGTAAASQLCARHFAQHGLIPAAVRNFPSSVRFKAGVVCHTEPVSGRSARSWRMNSGRGSEAPSIKKERCSGWCRVNGRCVGILKWHLLVGLTPSTAGWRADGLEIQVADGIFELAEKRGKRGAVNVRLAGEQGGALDGLIVGERDVGGMSPFLDARLRMNPFWPPHESVKTLASGRNDQHVVQRTVTDYRTAADLNIGCAWHDDALHGIDLFSMSRSRRKPPW